MNNRKFACGVTPSTINLIAELKDETDQSFLHAINTDEKNDEIKIDQARANYLKTRESDPQEVNSGAVKKSIEEENHEIVFKDLLFFFTNAAKTLPGPTSIIVETPCA